MAPGGDISMAHSPGSIIDLAIKPWFDEPFIKIRHDTCYGYGIAAIMTAAVSTNTFSAYADGGKGGNGGWVF